MTYPDIRKWLLASQGGCKLFQTGVMWLISSDNWADGTCAMLVITLGSIFGAKNAKREGSGYRPLFQPANAKIKRFFFKSPAGQFFCCVSSAVMLVAPEVGSSSSRAITDRKKTQPSWGLLTSEHPRPASARCRHFLDQPPAASTNSSTWATRGLRCAADVRFQSCAAASVFAWAALWG